MELTNLQKHKSVGGPFLVSSSQTLNRSTRVEGRLMVTRRFVSAAWIEDINRKIVDIKHDTAAVPIIPCPLSCLCSSSHRTQSRMHEVDGTLWSHHGLLLPHESLIGSMTQQQYMATTRNTDGDVRAYDARSCRRHTLSRSRVAVRIGHVRMLCCCSMTLATFDNGSTARDMSTTCAARHDSTTTQ